MTTNESLKNFLPDSNSSELLLKLTWDEWLAIEPPYSDRHFHALGRHGPLSA